MLTSYFGVKRFHSLRFVSCNCKGPTNGEKGQIFKDSFIYSRTSRSMCKSTIMADKNANPEEAANPSAHPPISNTSSTVPPSKKGYRSGLLNQKATNYEQLKDFHWNIPEYFNIGLEICDYHANGVNRNNPAVVYEDDKGDIKILTFGRLKSLSNQLCNALLGKNVKRGDRIGILLGQTPETAISHIAAYKLGCLAIPLFTLFGPEALEYRLENSGTKVLITDSANLAKIVEIKNRLPQLEIVIVAQPIQDTSPIRKVPPYAIRFSDFLEGASVDFTPVQSKASDPALIIYTSGTTGPPKGALHAHQVLIGHLPGVEFPHNLFPSRSNDLMFYTPADWAWIGGLIDVLLPSLYYGVPVLACRSKKFDPELTYELMKRHQVTNTFMPPTSLKMMRQLSKPLEKSNFLLSIGSGGECLGEELLAWGKETFGTMINEFYGQTEANLLIGNCSKIMDIKPGYIGKAIPGRTIEVVNEKGEVLKPGEIGYIAVKRPDPVIFLEYWKNPKDTSEKFAGDWLLTGDLGRKDQEGFFKFLGRSDDVIKSSGYRIGPSEIENCLLRHPAVSMCAVIGVPDELRNEIIKAFVVLRTDISPSEELKIQIQNFVKERLAVHEYPREVEFVNELPMTPTGKIIRKVLKEEAIQRKK